tara:strand:- start:394 stop:519 length:126 start_codon:yes stop_codon:yes gene_type:complete
MQEFIVYSSVVVAVFFLVRNFYLKRQLQDVAKIVIAKNFTE